VTIDPLVLATLEEAEFRSGMAEVIKHGIIGAPDLLADLETKGRHGPHALTPVEIARALRVKIDVVEEDPYEQDRRAILNLGHTVGHALEKLSRFELRHGEAVSIGMVASGRIAVALDRASPTVLERIESMLSAWGLPVRCLPFEVSDIWHAMAHDKKRRGDTLRWVLPNAISDVTIVPDVPKQTVFAVLREMGARE
jgi:3-dehydroquinate synthetase